MDIFALAQEGMKIQEEEIKALADEAAEVEAAKKYKLDIFEVLGHVAQKDYKYFHELGENQKHLQPFMINLWMSHMMSTDTSRAISVDDQVYADILCRSNDRLNKDIFNMSKEMFWLMACTVNDYDIDRFNIKFLKGVKDVNDKVSPQVLTYLSTELWTSKEKILDMIANGLITPDELKAIQDDYDTLEDPKKKKK